MNRTWSGRHAAPGAVPEAALSDEMAQELNGAAARLATFRTMIGGDARWI